MDTDQQENSKPAPAIVVTTEVTPPVSTAASTVQPPSMSVLPVSTLPPPVAAVVPPAAVPSIPMAAPALQSSTAELASSSTKSTKAPPASAADPGSSSNQHHPVAEFLYQLTKMLTDDNNEIIEWVDGRIKVHYPERLEGEVLHKYFRHSKFASFQRQLNYFGFRKIAGKGKMSPCSYVNESATSDIRSLLLIKRKTNGSAARKAMAQRALTIQAGTINPALGSALPGLAGAPGFGALVGGPVGLAALNQIHMQKQLSSGFLNQENPLTQLLQQNQRQSWNDLQQLGALKPALPSMEQIQAQLASLAKQQSQGGATAALNAACMAAVGGGASAMLSQLQQQQSAMESPATAALNAAVAGQPNPATAAMNSATAAAAAVPGNSLFDSAANLKALIGNEPVAGASEQAKAPTPAGAALLRLPSAGVFPGLASSTSLGNLLASSNRLSSLLSLNSFLSREPSLADLAMLPNGAAQLTALGLQQQQQQQQNQQDLANKLNQASNS